MVFPAANPPKPSPPLSQHLHHGADAEYGSPWDLPSTGETQKTHIGKMWKILGAHGNIWGWVKTLYPW